MKRAQITMETLLLYGVAILIVLLAVAALVYFGVLDLGGLLPEKCDLESTSTFKCQEWTISKSGNSVKLVVENTASKGIAIDPTNTKTYFTTEDAAVVGDSTGVSMYEMDGTTALPQDTAGLYLLPSGKSAIIEFTGATVSGDDGDRGGGEITISHKLASGAFETVTKGDLRASVAP